MVPRIGKKKIKPRQQIRILVNHRINWSNSTYCNWTSWIWAQQNSSAKQPPLRCHYGVPHTHKALQATNPSPAVTSLVSVNQRWMASQRCGQCSLAFSAELQSLNAFLSDSWPGIEPLLKNISELFIIFKNSTLAVWLSFWPVTWRATSRAWNQKK